VTAPIIHARHLNDLMQFDHVIQVLDGVAVDSDLWGPENVIVDTDEDGQILAKHETTMRGELQTQGWACLTGWSGQDRYTGPIMHTSEYVGGGLADYILASDGFYVAVIVYVWTTATPDDEPDLDVAGWMVLAHDPR
jgi:hypothetical protein